MTTRNRQRWMALVMLVSLAGCGPSVKIVQPADGEVVDQSSLVARMDFSAPARTFQVVLDGSDVSRGFFLTDSQAAGQITGLKAGDHVLSVFYLAKTGFEDTDQVIFSVSLPVTLDTISASPATLSLAVGATAELTITGELSDGTTEDVTADPNTLYGSSDTSIVTVSETGVVTAVAAGTATIGVSFDGATTTIDVTVAAAAG